jgi:glycerol-3-phosphate dehydrogenase
LRVALCEQDDLGAHTSSSSTKLVHGGLRYLEHAEFRLVRKALREREVLLACAPHIMQPLRFVVPLDPSMRPAWMIRCGLFLYDHLARREFLPPSGLLDLRAHPAGTPLRPGLTKGFAYSDVRVDDARLVVLCAIDARERGARVMPRTRCEAARRTGSVWTATLADAAGRFELRARVLVNACGPWAASFAASLAEDAVGGAGARRLRLVKGSHIVVPRLFDHPFAYLFQGADRRVAFAIPYERDFTLIGTTDVDYAGEPGRARIDPEETRYLCALANRYFRQPVGPADVVWSYAGVRPLLEDDADASAVTRDYALEFDAGAGAPLLTVLGGKITTFRTLAEEAVDRLGRGLGLRGGAWTHRAVLPGGDLAQEGVPAPQAFESFLADLKRRYPWLAPALLRRCAHAYGARLERWLGAARSVGDLGAPVLPGLYEAELEYLVEHEWARSAEDILWRRTKLGLHVPAGQHPAVERWLQRRMGTPGG